MKNYSNWVTVYVASSLAEAEVFCGLLKSEGLQATVAGSELSDEFGMARKLGPVEVGVPSEQEAEALDIVAAWRAHPTNDGNTDLIS